MNIEYGEQEKAQLATQLYQRHVKDCTVGCPKKSKSPNFGMPLTPGSDFHRLDEPPEKNSAFQTHKRNSASHFQVYIVITMGKLAKNLIWS